MRNMVALLLAVATCSGVRADTPFLSTLKATKDSPLYTTYAAAMERSEFTLDEGYHFVFYDSSRGLDFTTDMAGDICLAFKRGSKYVYELRDMFKEPVLTTSYSDIVKYTCYAFQDIRIDVTFLVYSSSVALLDVALRNEGTRPTSITAYPFLHNTYRTFEQVAAQREKNAFTLVHEELPDSWVLEHKIPYVGKVQNLFLFSESPDRMGSFRSYQWGTVEIPQVVDIGKKPVYVVWGRVTRKDGSRCSGDPKRARLLAVMNGDTRKILTETAPRWGGTDPNFNRYSLYGIELGNFGSLKDGDQYGIMIRCGESDDVGSIAGTIRGMKDTSDVRIDLQLGNAVSPGIPEGLRKDIWGSGTEIRLYWKRAVAPVTYNVYRRDYRSGGAYDLLAGGLRQTFYTDKNITGDQVYGYVVVAVDSSGRMSMHSEEVNNIAGSDFLTDVRYPGQISGDAGDLVKVVAFSKELDMAPGASSRFRVVRAVARLEEDRQKLFAVAQARLVDDLEKYVKANEVLYAPIPRSTIADPEREMMYWSAFTLMRQVMLPPEGKCSFNYYVFSREPQWGWGHGGQVFHESLTMLAYAYMDPVSAMNSQRVYVERQHPDGYINYRTGPYLDESIPHEKQLTTSAPWYAWQNLQIYNVSKDRNFLEEAYRSSKAFYAYYVKNRDSDSDGLCEWGGHAVLESVRDARVAVWDEVGWPSNFEAVDLNSMLVKEAKSLAAMASALGYADEAKGWEEDAARRAKRINEMMWDERTGFYYNVDKKSHSFTFKKTDDLKRQEIIGFLPLWAGVASEQQARKLVLALTDPKKFWRQYGVPSLSADDPYYNAKGYWNGPVWVEWDYLVVRGLLDYGFTREARDLTERVASSMIAQLKKDHNFWEFYSPDEQWAGYHKTYIWAGIINRMMMDVLEIGVH